MANFNLVKNQKYSFIFSAILIIASLAALVMWGLKPGLDFTGGSLLEVTYSGSPPSNTQVLEKLKSLTEALVVAPTDQNGFILKMKSVDEAKHQQILSALKELSQDPKTQNIVTEKKFEMVGPTVSTELRTKSFEAIVFVLLAIIIYIAFAFRKVSRPVSSWKYGVCAVIALFHDVIIPSGVFAALGRFLGVEVDTLFVTALLTVLGFSVHDTIVVFDRIRENLLKYPRETFDEVVNRSVNQTMARSINTSLTVLLVLLAAFLLGGASTKYFILTLIVGVVFGTYSSIFIASPLLVVWQRLSLKK